MPSRRWSAPSPPARTSTHARQSPRRPWASSRAGCRSPPAIEEHGGRPAWRWGPDRPRVLLLGHLDTVWPLGSLARLPFSNDGERLRGPGVFDMKAGVVQGWAALALAGITEESGVGMLLTTDEEIGSHASRELIRVGELRSRRGPRAGAVGRRGAEDRAQGHLLVRDRPRRPGCACRPRSGARHQRPAGRLGAGPRSHRTGPTPAPAPRSPRPSCEPVPRPTPFPRTRT